MKFELDAVPRANLPVFSICGAPALGLAESVPRFNLYGRNAEASVIFIQSMPMDNTQRVSGSANAGSHNLQTVGFASSSPMVEDTPYTSTSPSWLKPDSFSCNPGAGGNHDDCDHHNLNWGLHWTPSVAMDTVLGDVRQDYDEGSILWGNARDPRAQVASGSPNPNRPFDRQKDPVLAVATEVPPVLLYKTNKIESERQYGVPAQSSGMVEEVVDWLLSHRQTRLDDLDGKTTMSSVMDVSSKSMTEAY